MNAWHHAYNGLPAEREQRAFSNAPEDQEAKAFYGDGAPPGHDHLGSELLSGRIDVTIRVKSPTLPAHQMMVGTDNPILVVPSLSGNPEGAKDWEDATIPTTSLKGVLSSAYEAVTMSRLRVFDDHSHVVTSRKTTHEALNLYPVLLEYHPDAERPEKKWQARVMLGDNRRPDVTEDYDGWQDQPSSSCAAIIPNSMKSSVKLLNAEKTVIYEGGKKSRKCKGNRKVAEQRLKQLRKLLPDGSEVEFYGLSEPFFQERSRIVVLKASKRQNRRQKWVWVARSKTGGAERKGPFSGIVVRTTPPKCGPLTKVKCNEYVFFNREGQENIRLSLADTGEDPSVIESLIEILSSYAFNVKALAQREERAKMTKKQLKTAKGRTSLSSNTHIVHQLMKELRKKQPKTPLYELEVDRADIRKFLENHAKVGEGRWGIPLFASIARDEVTGLYPAQIGRRASRTSPDALARAAKVEPAREVGSMSPAERMWGFVAPERESPEHRVAMRGRIRIGAIKPIVEDGSSEKQFLRLAEEGKPWVLPVAAEPKPSTGAPYLRLEGGEAFPEENTRGEAYSRGQRLIRKTYPTHRFMIDKKELPGSPPGPSAESGENQPRVGSYLAPEATFTTSIFYEGMTSQEISVLLWLLSPQRLIPRNDKMPHPDAKGLHHLGFGKPLGMGAVKITATRVVQASGAQLASGYKDLTSCLGLFFNGDATSSEGECSVDALIKDLPIGFEESLSVRSFQRSAYGWDDARRRDNVSYPDAYRQVGNDELSPIITWFKNREEGRVKNHGSSKEPDHRYDFKLLEMP